MKDMDCRKTRAPNGVRVEKRVGSFRIIRTVEWGGTLIFRSDGLVDLLICCEIM